MDLEHEMVLSVSDFVAALNQTLEYAYPSVTIEGELSNFRVSKNRWVYYDLKDDFSSVKFFGTVYSLPGPLEDGMMLQVRGTPRLHQLYGFSVNFVELRPVGEGSLKRAAALLEAKLAAEGLFAPERKRPLPYPPKRIGLITSRESAAYHDFMKILNERWSGVELLLADVQVQGEVSPAQIVSAIEHFGSHESVDVLVITRGGGSAEDLAAFSTEVVTRAVAASRIPTLVAIGHEVDIGLAELAADQRASTPSNAAELLVPDKRQVLTALSQLENQLITRVGQAIQNEELQLQAYIDQISDSWKQLLEHKQRDLSLRRQVLTAYNPSEALKRGYSIARMQGNLLRSGKTIQQGQEIELEVKDSFIDTEVRQVRLK